MKHAKPILLILFVIGSYLYAGGDQFERETTEQDNFQLEILKAEQKQFEDFRFGRSREVNELAESEYE